MSRSLKTYLGVIVLVALLGAFSYMANRTNAPMPGSTSSQTADSCTAAPGGG